MSFIYHKAISEQQWKCIELSNMMPKSADWNVDNSRRPQALASWDGNFIFEHLDKIITTLKGL